MTKCSCPAAFYTSDCTCPASSVSKTGSRFRNCESSSLSYPSGSGLTDSEKERDSHSHEHVCTLAFFSCNLSPLTRIALRIGKGAPLSGATQPEGRGPRSGPNPKPVLVPQHSHHDSVTSGGLSARAHQASAGPSFLPATMAPRMRRKQLMAMWPPADSTKSSWN